MKFSKKTLLIFVLIIVISLTLLFVLISNNKEKKINDNTSSKTEEQLRKENENKLLNELDKSKAIEVRRPGFTITYEQGKNRFIILITENPFNIYKNNAFEYIKLSGIDRCKINYIVIQDRGVTLPLDSEELTGCK